MLDELGCKRFGIVGVRGWDEMGQLGEAANNDEDSCATCGEGEVGYVIP